MNKLKAIDGLDGVEKAMLSMPGQYDPPVTHHFHNGVYIRETFFPAGTLVIGHAHKAPTLNVMMMGRMLLASPDGPLEIAGPYTFVSPAGRKIAYVLEDTIFQNVFATDETDVAKIETAVIDKSAAWEQSREVKMIEDAAKRMTQ